jgi:hypothetical protein
VSDGPFAETKDFVGGFVVVGCERLDEATAIAAGHPYARRRPAGGRDPRRAAAADLHLLPSRVALPGARRAHPAHAGRHEHRGDRQGVPHGGDGSGRLQGYHLLPAARADLLRRAARRNEARAAYEEALALAPTDAERRYLEHRLREL